MLTDSYTFIATDGSTRTVTVNINGSEDAPTLNIAIADQTVNEDSAFSYTLPANSFGDIDISNTLTYSATLADDSALPAWLSFNATTQTFSGTPANADVGELSIKVTADDGSSTISDTFTLTVINTNDAPLAVNDSATTLEDLSLNNINVLANDIDVDGDAITVTAASAQTGNISINADGSLNYSPTPDFNGADIISYTIRDSNGATAFGSLTLSVSAVNDNPLSNDDVANTAEDITLSNINVLQNDTDVDGDSLTVTGASALFGSVNINPDNSLNYTPNPDFNGIDSISYTVSDGAGGTATGNLTMTVSVVVDALDDALVTDEDISQTINVLSNDTFGAGAYISAVTQGSHGSVTYLENGNITYIPDNDFNGDDSFSYTVTTAAGNDETATANVTVNMRMQPPILSRPI